MSEDDFLERLAETKDYDTEMAHSRGDDLVARALMSVGWARAAHAYNKAREDWWYA